MNHFLVVKLLRKVLFSAMFIRASVIAQNMDTTKDSYAERDKQLNSALCLLGLQTGLSLLIMLIT